MLSRIAEGLFWTGRYVERAEGTARILDVLVQHLLEDPAVDEPAVAGGLLAVMGVPASGDRPVGIRDVVDLLAFDPQVPSSITTSLTAARENARSIREAISSELWECLNTTFHALPAEVAATGGLGTHAFFSFVRRQSAMVAGLVDGTMRRDDGWRFFVLGRSLERADMTTRLLSARLGDSSASPEWVTTLRSCSAHEAYLRTYQRSVEGPLVAEFLLLDQLFPRSVFHSLALAERCLAELDPRTDAGGLDAQARMVLGRVRTMLEFRRIDELVDDLPALLAAVASACLEAGEVLARRYFRQVAALRWSVE